MMAQHPPAGRRRKIEETSSDESANAPELDTIILALKWRGDNESLEVRAMFDKLRRALISSM